MLKRYLLLFATVFFINQCLGQDTIQVKRKLSNQVTEVFTVLKSNVNIRHGSFRALYKNKVPVASGTYGNDKRVGLWRFYSPTGVVLQTYDYSHSRLFYEAPEDSTSHLSYLVDKELKAGDRVIKPIKIGGTFYGYLPYLTLFKLPKDLDFYRNQLIAVVELLVSPGGRLADYKVNFYIEGISATPFRTINMNLKLPDPAYLMFIPARLNDEPIASTIKIRCVVNGAGHLDFE